MQLFWSPQTRASRIVWMLEEAAVDYDLIELSIGDDARYENVEFTRASPMGKVPALVDGPVAMAESAAICLYVADRYSGGRLAPAIDDPARGAFLYWTLYTPAAVEPAMAEKFIGFEPNRRSYAWGDFDTMIATLRAGLVGRDWILGEEFSAADVMLGSSVLFMSAFGILPEDDVLSGYARRCAERPAYQKSQEIEAAGIARKEDKQ